MSDLGLFPPFFIALGWSLVHFLWQGLLLAVGYAIVARLMRGGGAVARYWVGMATLGLMVLAPVGTFLHLYDPVVQGAAGWPASELITVTAVAGRQPDLVARIEALLPWAVLVWMAGVLVKGAALTLDLVRVRRLATRDLRPLPPEWEAVVARLKDALGLRVGVRVVASLRASVPMVVGWITPVILIPPSALMGLTARQLELIISHELAHVRRLDYLFNLLQVLVETLLYYHPAVAWVSRMVRIEREHCCDDIVVSYTGDHIGYARALTEVEGLRCSSGMQVAMAATGGHLRGRVHRLVALPAPQRGVVYWLSAVGLLAGSLAAFNGLDLRPPRTEGYAAEPVTPAGAYAGPVEARPEPEAPRVEFATTEAPTPPAAGSASAPPTRERIAIPARSADRAVVAGRAPADRVAPPAVATDAPPGGKPTVADPEGAPGDPRRGSEAAAPSADGPPDALPTLAEPPSADARPLRTAALDARERPARAQAVTWEDALGLPELAGGALLRSESPAYPRRAQTDGLTGRVTVRYLVNREGRVTNVEVLESAPPEIFDDSVRRALRDWRYEPYTSGGRPVSQVETRTFEFSLEEQGPAPAPVECRKVTGSRVCRGVEGHREVGTVIIYNGLPRRAGYAAEPAVESVRAGDKGLPAAGGHVSGGGAKVSADGGRGDASNYVCRRERSVGSHMPKVVCRTRDLIETESRESQEALRRERGQPWGGTVQAGDN